MILDDTDVILLDLPIEPVPASRPRVTRYSTFYGKRYTHFKQEAEKLIETLYSAEPLDGPITASVVLYCKRAKTSKRSYPRGDVDNYAKAILDAANGKLYVDDDQIIQLTVTKLYATLDRPRISVYLSPWLAQ